MIESGSLTPGVSADMFGLPPHTALRYEQPAAALQNLITSYVVLDSDDLPGGQGEWMLPAWAQMWFILTDGPITVTIGNRRYDPMPKAALYGVTSRAMPVQSHGGVTVGVDLTALGWARLIDRPAEQFRDRVTPLREVIPPVIVAEIVDRLRGSDRSLQVKGILDDIFLRCMAVPHRDEPTIAKVMALITDGTVDDVATVAARLGIDGYELRRVSRRYFGFPPKTLMMRGRFLRRFVPMLMSADRTRGVAVPKGYHDASHFLRDANRFLGMTPRRFLAIDTPYLNAALRARAIVLGAATPTLDAAPPLMVANG
jgi:AraC-like DNA-binding protein